MPYDPLLHQVKRNPKTGSIPSPPTGPAGGDLSGTYPNPTVAKINGNPLGSTTPTSGHILVADGTDWDSVALSGDATLVASGALTLDTVNASPGTFTNATVTVNAKGLVTAASNGSSSSVSSGEAEVDFGATPYVTKKFTVVDANVTAGSKIVCSMSETAATGRTVDDNELDPIHFQAGTPASGNFSLIATALAGPVIGKYKVDYVVV